MIRPATPSNGGFTFAEHPAREAPEARIIWRAELDPGTLVVSVVPADVSGPDSIERERIVPWLTIVSDQSSEHAVLSDGWHHIRLDVADGSLATGRRFILHYNLFGVASAATHLLPLRRLVDLCRHCRFAKSLYPADRRVERWLATLRVHDALAAGASHREIAEALFTGGGTYTDVDRRADSLRSRVKRLIREARYMADGGYQGLIRRHMGGGEA